VEKNDWSKNVTGSISGVVFDGITIHGKQQYKSVLTGAAPTAEVKDVHFKSLVMADTAITSYNVFSIGGGLFAINTSSTELIYFDDRLPSYPTPSPTPPPSPPTPGPMPSPTPAPAPGPNRWGK
jgi:hypothetical protein